MSRNSWSQWKIGGSRWVFRQCSTHAHALWYCDTMLSGPRDKVASEVNGYSFLTSKIIISFYLSRPNSASTVPAPTPNRGITTCSSALVPPCINSWFIASTASAAFPILSANRTCVWSRRCILVHLRSWCSWNGVSMANVVSRRKLQRMLNVAVCRRHLLLALLYHASFIMLDPGGYICT